MRMPSFILRRPQLDFYLDLGLLRIGTSLWVERFESQTFEYVRVRFELFGKTRFDCKLYKTLEVHW